MKKKYLFSEYFDLLQDTATNKKNLTDLPNPSFHGKDM